MRKEMVVIWSIKKIFDVPFAPKIKFANALPSKSVFENVPGFFRKFARCSEDDAMRSRRSSGKHLVNMFPELLRRLSIAPSCIEFAKAFPRD